MYKKLLIHSFFEDRAVKLAGGHFHFPVVSKPQKEIFIFIVGLYVCNIHIFWILI